MKELIPGTKSGEEHESRHAIDLVIYPGHPHRLHCLDGDT